MGEVSLCDGGSKDSDVFFPTKKLRDVCWEVVLVGRSCKIPYTFVLLITGVVFSSYGCLDNGTLDNVPKKIVQKML